MRKLILLLSLCISACSHSPKGFDVKGADEFVTDSYRLRQGKSAILEMMDIDIPPLPASAMKEYRDLIAEDDILNVATYHPTRRDLMDSIRFINDTIGFRVKEGKVQIPDLPPCEVAGLTLDEAKYKLQASFREEIAEIEVYVDYKDRLARKVDLTGLVQIPYIPVDGKIRLYEVAAKAGIHPDANLFMSYVLRNGKPLDVDLHRLLNEGDLSQNIVMRGGDKIFIASPSDAQVMLMGEVGYPQPLDLPKGTMSLRKALVKAQGIPFTGNKRHIQVIRGNLKQPKIYLLNWEHIVHLPNESLLLMPGDTIYVSEKPITQWNRFISQLLPSATGLQTGYAAYRILRERD